VFEIAHFLLVLPLIRITLSLGLGLPAHQLRELNQIAAGVIDHGDF
jgi:hypothetical protein